MSAIEKFNGLGGTVATRASLVSLRNKAEKEGSSEAVSRIDTILENYPEADEFELEIERLIKLPSGLGASQHSGLEKEGLDECGRLRQGYFYRKGGIIEKAVKKGIKAISKSKRAKPTKELQKPKPAKQILQKKETKKTPSADKNEKKPAIKIDKKDQDKNVFKISILKLNTDEKRFQNRKKLNEAVLKQIAENYSETKLDPIIVWIDPKNKKIYVLAGHHRLEGTRRAGKKTIAIKYFTGTEKEAIHYAKVESNANRSLELPSERANIYRAFRLDEKLSRSAIEKLAREQEGKNASYILNLSFLNPKGIVLQAVEQLSESADKQNASLTEKIADWIGEARRKFDKLTNAHESELFTFLQDKEASKRIKSKAEFLQKLYSIAGAFDFNQDSALNLKRIKYQSQGEKVYEYEYSEEKEKLQKLVDAKADIISRLSDPSRTDFIPADDEATNELAANKIVQINKSIGIQQQKLIALNRNKGKYTSAGQNQVGLFGTAAEAPVSEVIHSISFPAEGLVQRQIANTAKLIAREQNTAIAIQPKTNAEVIPARSKNPLIKSMAECSGSGEFYELGGGLGEFLGRIEKKPKESVVITLDAPQGAGKTRLLFQIMNLVISHGYPVLYFSFEEHPDSELFTGKRDQYIDPQNRDKIDTVATLPKGYQDFKELVDGYEWIFTDSFGKKELLCGGKFDLDSDQRKAFDGKVFFDIYQRTQNGQMRGGSVAQFDADAVMKIDKDKTGDYKNNVAFFDKHRYHTQSLDELRYNIFHQELEGTFAEVIDNSEAGRAHIAEII